MRTMLLALRALAAVAMLAGCAAHPGHEPDYGGVEQDADEAQGELDRETAD
ncbi:MAG TPA: hypothetical protein VKA55_06985 [Gammaproteobacteria bacterium]|nr:hypothetical protein [Gammaproteobacteria bacterium]